MEKGFRALESETRSPAKQEMMGGEGSVNGADEQTGLCQPYTFSDGRDIEVPEKGKGVAAWLREAVLTASPPYPPPPAPPLILTPDSLG